MTQREEKAESGGSAIAGLTALCPSANFDFLGHHDPRLPEVATRAECAVGLDPVGALTHLRLFGELLTRNVAARMGLCCAGEEQQADRLRQLSRQGVASNVLDMLHSLRKAGNRATHEGLGTQSDAFIQLKIAFQLAVWFQRSFGNNRKFAPARAARPPLPGPACNRATA
jgi:type I restriction enzyme R subunit